VDPAHGDFSLRPGSPAAQIGFEPWDLSAVGPRLHPVAAKQDWAKEPKRNITGSHEDEP
jgi:hypothetical protein